jgi:hypothetical protein
MLREGIPVTVGEIEIEQDSIGLDEIAFTISFTDGSASISLSTQPIFIRSAFMEAASAGEELIAR